jgi:hypothetical protein
MKCCTHSGRQYYPSNWLRYFLDAAVSLLLLFTCSSFLPTAAITLYGRIQHSESLAPIQKHPITGALLGQVHDNDAVIHSGKSQEPLVPAQGKNAGEKNAGFPASKSVIWIPIPKWLAGRWVKQGDLTVSYTNLSTGVSTQLNQWTQNYQVTPFGNQIDGQGNIWHGYVMPTEFDGLSNGRFVQFVVVDGREELAPQNHLITRVHSVVFQQEELNDLYLLPSGELENIGYTRDFTSQGQAIREGTLVSHFSKIGTFQAVEVQDGIDMLASLNEYLRNHNMSQLVRTRLAER